MQLSNSEKYDIFAARDTSYSGQFYMAVKTTGIFCRPGCPARLPKKDNCLFFMGAEEAVKAGFRPCKRCHPMNMPGEASGLIKQLINLVESDPERKWTETDISALGIDPSTARRHFKARFGMTFKAYVRQRSLALARQSLAKGDSVINAQLSAGFESPSGFRAAFSKTFGAAPIRADQDPLLISWLDTPLGPMMTICDDHHIYLAEFTIRKNLLGQIEKLSKHYKRPILPGRSSVTEAAETQLSAYFKGRIKTFNLPLAPTGTKFQNVVWAALQTIPYGKTWSYSDLAEAVGNERAVRAVASSNAKNGLAIIIPCHRVISKGGGLGGYAGGLVNKQWLLDHERSFAPS